MVSQNVNRLPPPSSVREFREAVLGHYRREGRCFPWRETDDPWRVFVSEIMLQQTQTARVEPKYDEWFKTFPDIKALAAASLTQVYSAWKGLGYNNRALRLRESARMIVEKFDGIVPDDEKELLALPGVGRYTARAVLAFAFNRPTVLLETNIRSALIFHFFQDAEIVRDRDLEPVAAAVLDTEQPRLWNYALMDYGVFIKKREPNPSRKSASFTKQTAFEGSSRQARGKVVAALSAAPGQSLQDLHVSTKLEYGALASAVDSLAAEGIVQYEGLLIRFRD